jgi:hypothetical protein
MKEPIRMREGHELPSALRDAFGALSRDAPSEETVLRVQRALSALPASVPGAAAAGTLAVGKLLVVVTMVAGALAAGLVLTRRSPAPRAERDSAALHAPAPHALAPAEPDRAREASAAARATTELRESAAAPDLRARGSAQPGGDERALASPTSAPRVAANAAGAAHVAPRTARAHASSQPSSTQRAEQRAAPSGAEAAAPTDQGTPEPKVGPRHADQVPAALAPPARAAEAQASEAQRLAQCKRLALRDPEQALHEVEALAQQLPNGALVQERELLAIRLHEQLGHDALAAQLKQRFLERYPSSVYRRALAP